MIRGSDIEQNVEPGSRILKNGLSSRYVLGWAVHGDCYGFAFGVLKYNLKVARCYLRAISISLAQRGVCVSHFTIAELYEQYVGLRKNMIKALQQYISAADMMN